MKQYISRELKEKLLVQVYLTPLYFLIYMMFFYDPIGKVWEEREFNQTVQYKNLEEIYEIFGEPQGFEIRDDFIVLDYYDLVYPKKREVRYKFVRLLFLNRNRTVLSPKDIFFQE